MLTDILYSLPVRSGRSVPLREEGSRLQGRQTGNPAESAPDNAIHRFRELLATFSGRAAGEPARRTVSPASGTWDAHTANDSSGVAVPTLSDRNSSTSRASNVEVRTARGSSAAPIPRSPSVSFTPAGVQASGSMATADPTKNPLHPVFKVPMVSQAAREAYIHFSQQTGHVWNSSVSADTDQGGFATTTYRVPSWGMQDFVTSDGVRHRFDVALVYPTKGYSQWNGMDVDKIHPEVESFVLNRFKADLAAEGIPASAFSSIGAIRVHGGTSMQSWFVDVLRVEKPNGEVIYPQMNVAMRDPRHVMEIMHNFVSSGIPT